MKFLEYVFGKRSEALPAPAAEKAAEADQAAEEENAGPYDFQELNELDARINQTQADLALISKNHEALKAMAVHFKVALDCQNRLENLEASFRIVDGHNKMTAVVNDLVAGAETTKTAVNSAAESYEAMTRSVNKMHRDCIVPMTLLMQRIESLENLSVAFTHLAKKLQKTATPKKTVKRKAKK